MTQATGNVVVTENRDATKDDAAILREAYHNLTAARKRLSKATKAIDDVWLLPASQVEDGFVAARKAVVDAQASYFETLADEWGVIRSLPKGTVAPGGMTPQTIGLEFFNKNLNRDGKARLTRAAAAKINSAAAFLG